MKTKLAEKAADLVFKENYVIFGSGTTVNLIIDSIGKLHPDLSKLIAFSASSATSNKLREYNIHEGSLSYLHSLSKTKHLICVDSLDQIIIGTPIAESQMIKGHGAALFREKVVWKLAHTVLAVLDDTKVKQKFDTYIPITVVPGALDLVMREIHTNYPTFKPVLRVHGLGNTPVITDNGHYLIDIHYQEPISDLRSLHNSLKLMLGVVETGIFTSKNYSNLQLLVGYEDHQDHLV